jgi:hypothetical protein
VKMAGAVVADDGGQLGLDVIGIDQLARMAEGVGAHSQVDKAGPGEPQAPPSPGRRPLAGLAHSPASPGSRSSGAWTAVCARLYLRPAGRAGGRLRAGVPWRRIPDELYDLADELGHLDQLVGRHEHERAIVRGSGTGRSMSAGLVGYGAGAAERDGARGSWVVVRPWPSLWRAPPRRMSVFPLPAFIEARFALRPFASPLAWKS